MCLPLLLAGLAVALTGCSGSATTVPRAASTSPDGAVGPTTGAPPGRVSAPPSGVSSAASAPSPSVAVTLSACPPVRVFAGITPLARLAGDVDDLLEAAGGHLWVAAVTAGRLDELSAQGVVLRSVTDPRGPEGIAPLPDGTLAVAEQKADRVVRFDAATGSFTPILQLVPRAGVDGVDSIAADPARNRLLIPDSANGTLLALPGYGGTPITLARGLGRPVSAWPEPDGSVLVALENRPGVVRVGSDGSVTPVGALTDNDEAIALGGLIYVADLGGHALRVLDPRTGADRVLVSGVSSPQGLAVRADGTLLLTDSDSGSIVPVTPCA